jgi:periplasmic protein TonB
MPESPPPPPRPTVVEKPVRPPKPAAQPVARRPVAPARPATAPAEAARREPAPAAPAPPAEAPIAADWQRSLAAWLSTHKTYPELARRRGQQGSVALRFTADRSGRVLAVSVARSAGTEVLDSAAEAMVRNATLPPFPASMTQQTATITVTIRYTLVD